MFNGNYLAFWGSLKWQIKIDVYNNNEESEDKKFDISFFNTETDLENTFEVASICEFSKLMINVADGFGISIFDRRLANWVEDYFQNSALKDEFTHQYILDCLQEKEKEGEKIHVKVKKMTIADKAFTDSIEFDNSDLAINFEELYESNNIAKTMVDEDLPELFTIEKENIKTTINYEANDNTEEALEEFNVEYSEEEESYLLTKETENSIDANMKNVSITDNISWALKPIEIEAKLLDSDNTVISQFQPSKVEFISNLGSMKIDWMIEELEPNQKVIFSYKFVKNPLLDDVIKIMEERDLKREEEESKKEESDTESDSVTKILTELEETEEEEEVKEIVTKTKVDEEEEEIISEIDEEEKVSEDDLAIDMSNLVEKEEERESEEEEEYFETKIEIFSANEVFKENEDIKVDTLPIKMGIVLGTKQKLKARLLNPKGKSASYIDIIWKTDNFQRIYTLPICEYYKGRWSLEISLYEKDNTLIRELYYEFTC